MRAQVFFRLVPAALALVLVLALTGCRGDDGLRLPMLVPKASPDPADAGFAEFGRFAWGYLDSSGQPSLAPAWSHAMPFSGGLGAVQVLVTDTLADGESRHGRWGFAGPAGKLAIPAVYERVGAFSEGLARVARPRPFLRNPADKTVYEGYADQKGRIVIPWPLYEARWDSAGDFHEGLAWVQPEQPLGDLRRMIDDRRLVGDLLDQYGPDLSTLVWTDQNPFGFIDRSGRLAIPADFAWVGDFAGGLAPAIARADRSHAGFIDTSGQWAIPAVYGAVQPFAEGLAAVMKDGRWGFIDNQGRLMIKPAWDNAQGFSGGVAAVAAAGKWGWIDRQGQVVILPAWDEAGDFSSGLAAVGTRDEYDRLHWGFIDHGGRLVIPQRYAALSAPRFAGGIVRIGVPAKPPADGDEGPIDPAAQGYLDTRGEWVYGPVVGPWDRWVGK